MDVCPHFDYDFQRFAKLPRNPTIMVLKFHLGSQDGQGWLGWKGILNYLFGF